MSVINDSTHNTPSQYTPLKYAVAVNGIFSGMSGLFLISLSSFISNLLGTLNSLPDLLYVFIGANLIVFSASLFVLATLVQKTPAIWTKIVVALDVGWVLGSVVLLALYSTYLSLFGVVIIAVVASIVGALAFWQWHSLMSVSVNSRQLA